MNQPSSRGKYTYEFASEADGAEISGMLEKTVFPGDIGLCYAKRPNAFLSAARDGVKSAIGIGRNIETGKIDGFGICTINRMLVNGDAVNVAYLGGLRVEKGAGGNLIRAYKMMGDFCAQNDVKYTYTTILKDNLFAQKMFTKRRKSMPEYVKHSEYIVNIIGKNLKFSAGCGCGCGKAAEADFIQLYEFIRKEAGDKIFFVNLTEEALKNGFFGLTYGDFYVMKDDKGEILCCGILWEQEDYKQLIIKKYSLKYKLLNKLAAPLMRLLGYPALPDEGGVIQYATLSFVLVKDKNPAYLKGFIEQISHKLPEKCGFFVYAATGNTPEAGEVLKMKCIRYGSYVYLVDWEQQNTYGDILGKNINVECGLL